MARGNGNPRVVRNFWVSGTRSDGVEVKGTGPVGSNGGMSLTILVRENGRISDTPLRVSCQVVGEDLLITSDQLVNGQKRVVQLYRGKH